VASVSGVAVLPIGFLTAGTRLGVVCGRAGAGQSRSRCGAVRRKPARASGQGLGQDRPDPTGESRVSLPCVRSPG
jgi:hypothetical protein